MVTTRTKTSQREVIEVKIPLEEIVATVKRNLGSSSRLSGMKHVLENGVLILSFQVEDVKAIETQEMRLEINFIEKEPEDGEEEQDH